MTTSTEEHGAWFTLSEASRILGVHPATIRQWSDEGKLPAFRTPGGHRRFAREDIDRMLQVRPIRGAGLQTYLVEETVERTRKGLPEAMAHAAWAHNLPEDERGHWRTAGRQLLSLVAQLASRATLEPDQRELALDFGRDYGRMMVRQQHSLPDAVVAFLFFRDSILETVLQLPETTGLDRNATLEIVGRVNALLNAVLRAMMDAFEEVAAEGDGVVRPGGEAV